MITDCTIICIPAAGMVRDPLINDFGVKVSKVRGGRNNQDAGLRQHAPACFLLQAQTSLSDSA
jgi:hypothetical protein